MIYLVPTMHEDYNREDMDDFVCTAYVNFFIRNMSLIVSVNMRSCDVVFGYKNDFAWQKHVALKLIKDIYAIKNIKYRLGNIYWHASNLHIYSRHFKLIGDYTDGFG